MPQSNEVIRKLEEANQKLTKLIEDTPLLISIGKPPLERYIKARNLLQCAISEVLGVGKDAI